MKHCVRHKSWICFSKILTLWGIIFIFIFQILFILSCSTENSEQQTAHQKLLTGIHELGRWGFTYAKTVVIDNNSHAFVSFMSEFVALDVSNPTTPVLSDTLWLPDVINKSMYDNDFCFSQVGESSIFAINVSDPAHLRITGSLEFELPISDFVVSDMACYIIIEQELIIYDLADPENPILLSQKPLSFTPRKIAFFSHHIAFSIKDGLALMDATDPANPVIIEILDLNDIVTGTTDFSSIAFSKNRIALSSKYSGIIILFLYDEEHMEFESIFYPQAREIGAIKIEGDYLLIGLENLLEQPQLHLYDIADLSAPSFINRHGNGEEMVDFLSDDNNFYIANNDGGFLIFDRDEFISNNDFSLTPSGTFDAWTYPYSTTILSNYILVSCDNSLVTVDISDPAKPVTLSSFSKQYFDPNYLVLIPGTNYAVISNDSSASGFIIVDVSEPAAIKTVYQATDVPRIEQILVRDSLLYCAVEQRGVMIYSLSDPLSPRLISTFELENSFGERLKYIALKENFLLCTTQYTPSALLVLDVSNPEIPVLKGSYFSSEPIGNITCDTQYAYISFYDKQGFIIIDLKEPTQPTLIATIEFYEQSDADHGIAKKSDFLYLSTGRNGLQVFNVSDPTAPRYIETYDYSTIELNDITLEDNRIFVADWQQGIIILERN